ncbi:MAG TPA: UvrD-helicase domain-containing protein [Microbacteriaceae bacterium]|nr:UvrD-helicase domain-containing protein [Microbacteriaceae bacterium]
MASAEVARERAYVHSLYERLDRIRDSVQRELDAVRAAGEAGGTHQSRTERDAFARIYEDRVAQLREIDERLAFGRLELQPVDGVPVYHYIGRIGLRDEDQQPILLDWRVPQASAFYQATAATPLGARARRHLHSRGRDVVGVDDEVFDQALLDAQAHELQGEAALMAALGRERTGRMQDIVATIQAEQDRIIRSDLHGALVVQGGPGTGKTAVALHRAAYLLYSHRERLASAGVLIVGPSRSFLEYIEAVLPSLGETGVVTASLGTLFPGVEATAEDRPEVAALKGSLEMARLLARAVKSRQVIPTEDQVVDIDGEELTVPAQLIRAAMQRAWETHRPHNVARVTFNKVAIAEIAALLAEQLRRRGRAIDDSDLALLREDIRTAYDVKVVLNTAWMPLTPEKLIRDLYARPNWLATITQRWSPEKRALLRRDREAPFTIGDIPLLDEAAELLGENPVSDIASREREREAKRNLENAQAAIRNMGVEGLVDARQLADSFTEGAGFRASAAELAVSDRTWTFGHIVVDEAQELSPMQWRLLVRKNPLKSFTIVGDVAQVASAAGTGDWSSALGPVFKDAWRLEELTVNYRTPAQISQAAEAMAEANGVPITPTTAVRHGDWPVEIVHVADSVVEEDTEGERRATNDPLLDAVLDGVARMRAEDGGAGEAGSVAVIAPAAEVDGLERALTAALGPAVIARGARGLRRPVALLTPQDAKGLEFDAVLVVEPAQIVADGPHGAGALYVAMTRATQRLLLVTSSALPAGLPEI